MLLSKDMPGKSFRGPLPALTASQKSLSERLRADVSHLAVDIGERNLDRPAELVKTRDWIESRMRSLGYTVTRQNFKVRGKTVSNLECSFHQGHGPVVVVGAHYDSARGCPAANDNGSGVASLLALAELLKASKAPIRFVAFVNEEPPYFQSEKMGSLVYAQHCQKRGDKIKSMVSLETMGCYSDRSKSQRYPPPLSLSYPSQGNFIAFIGNTNSGDLVKSAVKSFRSHAKFPSEGGALPDALPGVGWSDHWSFWQIGVPALMVTDTAPFRYDEYHKATDTPEKLDYDRLARVVEAVAKVLLDLAK
jgi:Zn-dependent M28 family amino/carboxypeptidase